MQTAVLSLEDMARRVTRRRGRFHRTLVLGRRYPERGRAAERAQRYDAWILPIRIRCGWSPTGMRATWPPVAYAMTATTSSPATETKQYCPSPLLVAQYGRWPT